MSTLQKSVKLTLDTLMSLLIWTAVFAVGILISTTLFRVFLNGGLTAYHWLHS